MGVLALFARLAIAFKQLTETASENSNSTEFGRRRH